MPIESSQYFIILFRVNQVFTFYQCIELSWFTLLVRKQLDIESRFKTFCKLYTGISRRIILSAHFLRYMLQLLLPLFLLSTALAHYQAHDWNAMSVELKLHGLLGISGICDDSFPYFPSYHIHVIFWSTNPERVALAMDLRQRFIERFNLGGADKQCTILAGDPAPGHEMCVFEPDMQPAGPFLQAQYSFFIPPALLQETSAWMLQHRGVLDLFIHPNTGCETNDHTKWYTVAGTTWPIDASIFSCDYPGCKPDY